MIDGFVCVDAVVVAGGNQGVAEDGAIQTGLDRMANHGVQRRPLVEADTFDFFCVMRSCNEFVSPQIWIGLREAGTKSGSSSRMRQSVESFVVIVFSGDH